MKNRILLSLITVLFAVIFLVINGVLVPKEQYSFQDHTANQVTPTNAWFIEETDDS